MPPKRKSVRKPTKKIKDDSESDYDSNHQENSDDEVVTDMFDIVDDTSPYINVEPQSLDPNDVEQKEEKQSPMFYFRVSTDANSGANKITYGLKQSTVKKLIPFFATMLQQTPPDTKEKAVPVDPIKVQDDCAFNSVYIINTAQQYKVVVDYVLYWENRLDTENYISPNKQQSGYIHQILAKFDLDLINTYVDEYLQGNNFPSNALAKYARISAINPLLKCVDGFLRMEGLSNKLYAYIAEIIRTCSIIDMSDNHLATHFKSLQLEAFEQWRKDNPELLHGDIETTGNN